MKIAKILAILSFVWAVLSCSKEMSSETTLQSETATFSLKVSIADVAKYSAETRLSDCTKAGESTIEPVLFGRDTVMYLVNHDDGWELMSANKLAPQVLAMSERGHMTQAQLFDCPPRAEYLERLVYFFSKIVSEKELDPDDRNSNWLNRSEGTRLDPIWVYVNSFTTSETIDIQEHLLNTQWYQYGPWYSRAPYNDSTLTTHCYTGCTMVAAAQVLYYLHGYINKPTTAYSLSSCNAYVPNGDDSYLLLNDSNVSFSNNVSSTWASMPQRVEAGHTDAEYGCVSTLMVRLGRLLGAKYYRNGTGVHLTNIPTVFNTSEFSIQCSLATDFSKSRIREQVLAENPLIMSVYHSVNDSLYSGHSIVVDGYKKVRETTTYVYENSETHQLMFDEGLPVIREYVGINWGWLSTFNQENTAGAMTWYYLSSTFFDNPYNYNCVYETVYGFQ